LFLARRQRRAEAVLDGLGAATPIQVPVQVPVPVVRVPIVKPVPAVVDEGQEIPWSSEDDERSKYAETAGDLTGDYYCLNFACWE
jgi:hypothetical protein